MVTSVEEFCLREKFARVSHVGNSSPRERMHINWAGGRVRVKVRVWTAVSNPNCTFTW